MNIQERIEILKNRIEEIRAKIATEKCNYKLEYNNLYILECELRDLIKLCQQ